MKYILSFLSYLKKPCVPQKVIQSKELAPLLWLFIFSLVIEIMFSEVFSDNKTLSSVLQSNGEKHFDDIIYKDGFIFSFITVVILGPIIEELIFRYYLTSFRANYVFLPINLSIIAVELFPMAEALQFCVAIAVCLLCGLAYNSTRNNSKYEIALLKFYAKQYWIFYYCSAMVFGVIHIGNYRIQSFIPALPLLLVLPQLYGGLLLGYVRITKGLKWSILFHAANNLIALIMLFASK
ncbi:MAG: CPBP family glutamic-type intramembrane protease [Chitinophagaceae bacterium]